MPLFLCEECAIGRIPLATDSVYKVYCIHKYNEMKSKVTKAVSKSEKNK